MKRLPTAILCALLLTACQTTPAKPVQYNVSAPTPLDKWNSSVEKLFTPGVNAYRFIVADFLHFTLTLQATGNAVATFDVFHNNPPVPTVAPITVSK